jgi:hypothetical protein
MQHYVIQLKFVPDLNDSLVCSFSGCFNSLAENPKVRAEILDIKTHTD